MRRIGNVLLWTGVVVGVTAAAWEWLGAGAGGLPWLVGIGLIKLMILAAIAMIATGGVALRLANRADRLRLLGTDPEVVITADRRVASKEPNPRLRNR